MTITVSGSEQTAALAAASSAAEGSKNTAYCQSIANAIGAGYKIVARRDSIIVLSMTMTGSLSVNSYGLVVGTSPASVDTLLAADIDSGTWTLSIEKGADPAVYISGSLARSGGDFNLSADLDPALAVGFSAPIVLRAPSLDSVGTPASPPASVVTWMVRSTDAPVAVPASFVGMHSDYIAGATYPAAPSFMGHVGTVRSLDHDPDRGWTTRLSWALMEPDANGSYVWTHMDNWVAEHSGKVLVYVIDRTPAGYAKYTTTKNLYPSLVNSSSPPSDWTKAANLCNAIRARYPSESFVFELWNEPNCGWADGAGGAITSANMYSTRMTDAFLDWAGLGGAFWIGTAQDLADGARILKENGVWPLMCGAWEGQTSDWLGNTFRRFSTCPTGGGVGADYADYWSCHSYTYDGDGRKLLAELEAYKTLAAALGYGSKPWMVSEIGHESPRRAFGLSDTQNGDNVIRWGLIAASMGAKAICYYNLDSAAPSGGSAEALFLKYYSDPNTPAKLASNAALGSHVGVVAGLAGKSIRQAGILSDGSIWVDCTDGTQVQR